MKTALQTHSDSAFTLTPLYLVPEECVGLHNRMKQDPDLASVHGCSLIGVMFGRLVLFNCPYCETTLSIPCKPDEIEGTLAILRRKR